MLYLLGEVIIAVVVIFITYSVISLYLLHRKYEHLPGPPLDSFLFGHGPSIIKHIKEGGHYFSYVLQKAKEHGPLFRLIIQNQVTVYTTHPKAVKELLVTGNHRKPKEVYDQLGYIFGARFLGEGVLSQSEHTAKGLHTMRAKIQHHLQRSCMINLMRDINETADALVTKLSTLADGKTKVKMFDEFNRMTMDLIGKVSCGMDINNINNDNTPFTDAFDDVGIAIIARGRSPLLHWNPWNWPYCWKIRRKCHLLRTLCSNIIMERQAAYLRGDYVPEDMLSHMMQATENDSESSEYLLDNVLTFFLAGRESSSILLSFIVICLGRFPEILDRLRKEIDLQIGEKPYVDFKDLSNMQYLDMVVKETLRMYSPSAATYRQVSEDYEIDGYNIPKGTTVCLSTYVLTHHEDYFEEPTKFDPQRFNPENENRASVYSYFPFSLGPRTCIGKHLAEMEIKVMIIKLIQRFNFVLDPDQDLGIEEVLLHRPKDKALCTLTLRGHAN